jgi:hypothetical protein
VTFSSEEAVVTKQESTTALETFDTVSSMLPRSLSLFILIFFLQKAKMLMN